MDVSDAAELFSGAYAGIQTMSQILRNRTDLNHRISVLLRYLLPSICTPALLTGLRLNEDRAEQLAAEYDASQKRREDQ
ncbi:gamma-butyrolactone-binding protein [Streptomyces narbonensis]